MNESWIPRVGEKLLYHTCKGIQVGVTIAFVSSEPKCVLVIADENLWSTSQGGVLILQDDLDKISWEYLNMLVENPNSDYTYLNAAWPHLGSLQRIYKQEEEMWF